ncbi:MAG: YbhB/YbcL family Raf kinase inhibitor-like protein [Bacteroidales bacterium]
MKTQILIYFLFTVLSTFCCSKTEELQTDTQFTLKSSEIQEDGLLPVEYTCDGAASTLPLEWSGFPEGTKSFAILMHHEASPTDIHWYWILYNIPAMVNSLPKNTTGIGTLGTNSVNDKTEYAPPCSQGPGEKTYIYTVFALSDNPTFAVAPELVDMEVFLNAIKDITISSASLSVVYSRVIK